MPAFCLTVIILSALVIFLGMGARKLWPSNENVEEAAEVINFVALIFGGCGIFVLLGYYMYALLAPLVN